MSRMAFPLVSFSLVLELDTVIIEAIIGNDLMCFGFILTMIVLFPLINYDFYFHWLYPGSIVYPFLSNMNFKIVDLKYIVMCNTQTAPNMTTRS